jgi:serine/threonine-protein kinase PpkA
MLNSRAEQIGHRAIVAIPEIPGYQLLRQIGSGGMATVFLAVQVSLERKVAIKVLRTSGDDDPERTEKRFLREGRTLAKITHKNVCGIFDIAKVGDLAYIAMEYLDGGTLVDRLKQGVPIGESIAIAVQVASALEEAHKLGIIHRDLKPANVMLRGGRVPVLTDFGIARELTASQTRITAENMIVGTPIYMSPEQVSGGEVDGRSDLYALGIMFFELLTGQPPYKGETPIAVCMQHLTAALPTLPPDLADLQPVLDRMLAKRREDRFDNMTAFTHALRDVFVASDSMREVANFSPDTPWSEQLRDLGFSFDTLRDADVKAALTAQRKRAGGQPRPPRPDVRTGVAAATTPVRVRSRWPVYLSLMLVVLAIGGGGAWWLLRPKPPTDTQLLALRQLRSDFTARMAEGKLFEPAGQSAMDAAREMRDTVHATADETIATLDALHAAVLERARNELARRDLIALDATIAAINRGLPELPELAELQQQRAQLAAGLAGEAAVRARLARLRALLDGAKPDSNESLMALFLELHGTLPDDAEFQALQPRAVASLRLDIEAAMAAGETSRALRQATQLAAALPEDASLREQVASIEKIATAAEIKRLNEVWKQTLAAGPVDSARLAELLKGIAALEKLGQGDADLGPMRQLLSTVVLGEANGLVEHGDHDAALALLGQARVDLPGYPSLLEAQQRITAERGRAAEARRGAEEQALQGQVAISSAPWATIAEIVDGAGKRLPLPAEASTPLLMTLPEGRYLITLVSGQGTARRQEGVAVTRGKLVNINVRFEGYDADRFLREVGW